MKGLQTVLQINPDQSVDDILAYLFSLFDGEDKFLKSLDKLGKKKDKYGFYHGDIKNDGNKLEIIQDPYTKCIAVRETISNNKIDVLINPSQSRFEITSTEKSLNNSAFHRILMMMVDKKFLQKDLDITIANTPSTLDNNNLNILSDIINGNNVHLLPVVYISRHRYQRLPITRENIDSLSLNLCGVAHVLIENNSQITNALNTISSNHKIPGNGTVAIYYPSGDEKWYEPIHLLRRDSLLSVKIIDSIVTNMSKSEEHGETYEEIKESYSKYVAEIRKKVIEARKWLVKDRTSELLVTSAKPAPCYVDLKDNIQQCLNAECEGKRLEKRKIKVADKKFITMQCPNCGTLYIKKGLYELHPEVFDCKNKNKDFTIKKEVSVTGQGSHKAEANKEHVINAVDVLVKGNTFKCIHSKHRIDPVTAIVPVIDKHGNLVKRKAAAGYCHNCNTYFIRESTYQSLKSSGTIACRVQEEKAYYHGGKGFNDLADQSILMEYGYSVSSTRNLSPLTRHRILSMIIDNGIMQKSEIVNYLEFFINQRKYQSKNFDNAIDKWQSDISYVMGYGSQSNKEINVRSIQHKSYSHRN